MARSEKKTDLSGREYVQHYDERGRETIRSYVETNKYTGKKEVVHYNEEGRKCGVSQKKKDYWTEKEYVETEYYDPHEFDDFFHSLESWLPLGLFLLLGVVFVVSYIYFT